MAIQHSIFRSASPSRAARPLAAALSFGLALTAGAAPLATLDFTTVADGVAEAPGGALSLHIDDSARVLPGGPTGKPCLVFDGSPSSSARLDARLAAQRLKGDEVGVSFWLRPDRLGKDVNVLFGVYLKEKPDFAEAPLGLAAATKPTDFGSYSLTSRFEGPFATGTWHHVAYAYSLSNLTFRLYYDGVPMRDIKITEDAPAPLDAILTQKGFCKQYVGAVADIRVWDYAPTDGELLTMDVSAADANAVAADFSAAATRTPAMKSFSAWCTRTAARAREIGAIRHADVREWQRLQLWRSWLPRLGQIAADTANAPSATGFADAPFLPMGIYPFAPEKRLPFLFPFDARALPGLDFTATLGEFEALSFMAFPFADADAFHMKASDLVGPDGARLPASAIDIRTVKVWFTSALGWNSYFGGGRDFPTLSPELILHDDALVKVDYRHRRNLLRVSYPDGARYVDVSQYGSPENMEPFAINIEPVFDAKEFQPLPLRHGALRQFWITAHAPADAAPGVYRGHIDFTNGGKTAGSVPVSLTILPYQLPHAATRYNIDREFFGTWMNHIGLADAITGDRASRTGSGSLTNAIIRTYNQFRNMAEHNQRHPWVNTYGAADSIDLADIELDLMEKAGLATRPLFGNFHAFDGFWCAGMKREIGKYPNRDISVEAQPELFHQSMASFSNSVKQVADRVEKRFGHRDVFMYGIDEAGPATVRREMPFFSTARHFGGRPLISMCCAQWVAHAVDIDDCPARYSRTNARNWHEGGARVTTYAAPFSGPENPSPWRRDKGVRLYMSNFDGGNEYVWYEGWNVWNDGAYLSRYRPFCIVYPTFDGVVDTVAWEALREGVDDVRYLTLLRRLARAAIRSGDRPLVRLGRRAYAWAELVDADSDDLDVMRATAIRWIADLRDALAKAGIGTAASYE